MYRNKNKRSIQKQKISYTKRMFANLPIVCDVAFFSRVKHNFDGSETIKKK